MALSVDVASAETQIAANERAANQRGNCMVNSVLGCKAATPVIGKLWGPNLTAGTGSFTRDASWR